MDEKLEKYLTGKNFIMICILLLVVLILLIITAVGDLKKDNKVEKKEEIKTELVTNASRFYTVSSCINKYLLYLSDEDETSLLAVLDASYISKNNITEENVLEKIGKLAPGDYSFSARKMHQEQVSETITKYYVFGNIVKNEALEINTMEEKQSAYYIIKLDASNLTFSVTPYDGKIFK